MTMPSFFLASNRSKTLARWCVPAKCLRLQRRKFARLAYRLAGVIKGFAFGVLSVGLLWVAQMVSAHAQSTNADCGGTSQPRCEVNVSVDADMSTANTNAQAQITTNVTSLKGSLDSIDNDKFKWSFVPQIPTSVCVNPQLRSPLKTSTVEMDICTAFNTFQTFMNGVLAVFCVFGCVQQVQSALRA